MCGGGTRNPLLLREHADALGRDPHLVADEDAVTLGAALLGATAAGRFAELPAAEFERRRRATSREWPLLNCVLAGVSRDQLMAGHQSNHIGIACVDEDELADVLRAFVVQALTQNIRTLVAGSTATEL